MNMGHHVLPTARRANSELDRYVRSEYRDGNATWLTSRAVDGARVLTIGNKDHVSTDQPTVRCCPVTGAVSGARPVKWLSLGGEPSGNR